MRLLAIYSHYHRAALLIGVSYLFFSLFNIHNAMAAEHFRITVLGLIVVSSIYLFWLRHLNRAADRSIESDLDVNAVIWIGVCALFLSVSIWNWIYIQHINSTNYQRDVFREQFHTYFAPLYGASELASQNQIPRITSRSNAFGLNIVLISLFSTLVYLELRSRFQSLRRPYFIALAIVVLLLILGFSLTQDGWRLVDDRVDLFSDEAFRWQFGGSLQQIWHQWNEAMPDLPSRLSHYPPGGFFIGALEMKFSINELSATKVVLSAVLCAFLVYQLAISLGGTNRTAVLSMALFCSTPAVVTYPSTHIDPIGMLLALLSYLFVSQAIDKRPIAAMYCGVTLGLYSIFSFSVFIAGIIVLATIVLAMANQLITLRYTLLICVMTAIPLLLFWLLLYAALGFNIVECLQTAIAENQRLMASTQFDNTSRYFLRSTGNFIAYAVSSGPILLTLAVIGMAASRRRTKAERAIAVSLAIAITFASFGTLFFMETERIWLFFTPVLAITAAWGIEKAVPIEKFASAATFLVFAAFVGTLSQELFLLHSLPSWAKAFKFALG